MVCGGTLETTITIVLLVFLEAFLALKMGFGAALSFILFAVIALITIINSRILSYDIGY